MQDQLVSDYIEFTHKNKDYQALHEEFQKYRIYDGVSSTFVENMSKGLGSEKLAKTAVDFFAAKPGTERSAIARQLLIGGFATLLSPVMSSVLCVMRELVADQKGMADAVQTYFRNDVEVEFEEDLFSNDEYVGIWSSVWERKGKPPFLLIQGATKDNLDPKKPKAPRPPSNSQPAAYAWKPPTSSGGIGLGKKIVDWFKSAGSSIQAAVSSFFKTVSSGFRELHKLLSFMVEDALAAGMVGAGMGASVGGVLGVGFGALIGAPTLHGAVGTAAGGGAIGAVVGGTLWGIGGGIVGGIHGAFRYSLSRATDGVKAFPNGEGDVVIGRMPGWPGGSSGRDGAGTRTLQAN
jgi:hypothetical protein